MQVLTVRKSIKDADLAFHYLLEDFEHVISTEPDDKGILVALKRKEPSFMHGAEIEAGNLELLRNHECIVWHVPELLSIWRGNIEQKLIKSPRTFLK